VRDGLLIEGVDGQSVWEEVPKPNIETCKALSGQAGSREPCDHKERKQTEGLHVAP